VARLIRVLQNFCLAGKSNVHDCNALRQSRGSERSVGALWAYASSIGALRHCSRGPLTATEAVIDRVCKGKATEPQVKASCGAFAAVLEVSPFVVGQKVDNVAPQPGRSVERLRSTASQFPSPFLPRAAVHLSSVGFSHHRGQIAGDPLRLVAFEPFDFDLEILRQQLSNEKRLARTAENRNEF
jgi:hypothetical protein